MTAREQDRRDAVGYRFLRVALTEWRDALRNAGDAPSLSLAESVQKLLDRASQLADEATR